MKVPTLVLASINFGLTSCYYIATSSDYDKGKTYVCHFDIEEPDDTIRGAFQVAISEAYCGSKKEPIEEGPAIITSQCAYQEYNLELFNSNTTIIEYDYQKGKVCNHNISEQQYSIAFETGLASLYKEDELVSNIECSLETWNFATSSNCYTGSRAYLNSEPAYIEGKNIFLLGSCLFDNSQYTDTFWSLEVGELSKSNSSTECLSIGGLWSTDGTQVFPNTGCVASVDDTIVIVDTNREGYRDCQNMDLNFNRLISPD